MAKATIEHRRMRFMAILRFPGLWLLVGGLEAMFLIHLSEFLYPGYSVSEDYISDLGVGPMPSSAIFTIAIVLFGLMAIVAASLLRMENKKSRIWVFIALAGVGAIGVGVFNEDYPLVHRPSAFLILFFGNLAAVYSCKIVCSSLSYVFAILGLIGLVSLGLFGAGVYVGLGVGGMERMIFYPTVFWVIGFGTYLSAEQSGLDRK